MTYSLAALNLRTVDTLGLPRIDDRVSFLYLEHAVVTQNRTGITAWLKDRASVTIPAASLGSLLLGPGTSITHEAATTLFRSGCVLLWVSQAGLTGYQAATPLTGSGRWAQAQTRLWTDPSARRQAALHLYGSRLPTEACTADTPLKVLRGLEGRMVKLEYRRLAAATDQRSWHRDTSANDPINTALNLGNAILYGCALIVCSALAISPSLGIIHQGSTGALLYDLADIYKLQTTIPAAFLGARQPNPAAAMRRSVRRDIVRRDIVNGMFKMIAEILEPHVRAASSDDVLLDDDGAVPGHTNWYLQ